MKHSWKKELARVMEAPAPLRKKEFIRTFEQADIGFCECILIQAGYIRRWVWAASLFVCFAAFLGPYAFSEDMLWWICAWMPLLAVTIVSESGRSEDCGMAELEMATRFSLKSVLLARMGILGTVNLLLFVLMLPAGTYNSPINPVQAACCMLTPFLLTAYAGFSIMRRFRGKESGYLCAGAAVCIGTLVFFLHDGFPRLFEADYLVWWAVCAVVLVFGTGRQYCRFINEMEEMLWNLS